MEPQESRKQRKRERKGQRQGAGEVDLGAKMADLWTSDPAIQQALENTLQNLGPLQKAVDQLNQRLDVQDKEVKELGEAVEEQADAQTMATLDGCTVNSMKL
ncbi:hypothetical protein scyTo_0014545 [Scyliorhinus torazame]|uniref:t-SNARE coiled-coil homology domain-containing protein n=1 Tax=Scyliorhinus torazame TaxID=75743 RepID=A0A401NPN6_SCYTO|nr:hypothetical protein [Scyliorhinus torazame]